jgi:segregation and condensation protein B
MTLNQIVEALLFASQGPLTAKAVAKIVKEVSGREEFDKKLAKKLKGTTAADVETAIAELNDTYDKDGVAFLAEERANGWKLYTRADYGEFVRELFPGQKAQRLSQPALETLAIVAYRQPITKAAIEAVRGVTVDGVLHTLIDRGLVRVGGRADLPGRPLLYETSDTFLEHFGIKGVDDLPNAVELRQVALPQPEEETAPEEEQLPLVGVASGEGGEGEDASETEPPEEGAAEEAGDAEPGAAADDEPAEVGEEE